MFTGRVVVVTGAGSGLGREHALVLAGLGAKVVVNDLPSERGDRSRASLVAEEVVTRGGTALAVDADVSVWDAAESLIEAALSAYGRLDVLVNNAGIIRNAGITNMTEAEWDDVIDADLKGHFAPLRSAARYWRRRVSLAQPMGAAVVNTASGAGMGGNPGQANYSSAKAGIIAMTLVAARELEKYDVRVNAVAPIARTPMTESIPALSERFSSPRPGASTGDLWHPRHVSNVVAWLASDRCALTGELFSVGGGRIACHERFPVRRSIEGDRVVTIDEVAEKFGDLPRQAFRPIGGS